MGFKVKKEYGVIGLGGFGMSVVDTLLNYSASVMVLDENEEKIQKVANRVDYAYVVDATDETELARTGIKNVDHVFVGIGDDVEGCIMTVMALKNIGIENITVKSGNDKLTDVLKTLGVTDIVNPEKEVGMMVAKRKMYRLVSDFVSMDEKHSLVQIKIENEKLFNKPLSDLGFRNKFNLNIVAIKNGNGMLIPSASTVLHKDDILYLIGEDVSIHDFEKYLDN